MPTRRSLVRFSMLFATLLSAGGCGPPWKVIRASGPPSALKGAREVGVAFDYSRMQVEGMSEADWVASKHADDPKYKETWADLKGRLESAVVEGMQRQVPQVVRLVQPGQAPPVVLRVQVVNFRLGKFIPVVLPPTVVDAELLWTVDGKPADLIWVHMAAGPSMMAPSVFTHIGPVGRGVGVAAGGYLKSVQ